VYVRLWYRRKTEETLPELNKFFELYWRDQRTIRWQWEKATEASYARKRWH
jgi:hypothetical protein